jgi:hypothetical protein
LGRTSWTVSFRPEANVPQICFVPAPVFAWIHEITPGPSKVAARLQEYLVVAEVDIRADGRSSGAGSVSGIIASYAVGGGTRGHHVRVIACQFLCVLAAVTAIASPQQSDVVCTPGVHYRFVGTMGLAGGCTDSNVQSAIDNATCPNTVVVITNQQTYTLQALTIADKSLTLFGVEGACAVPSCDPALGCGGGGQPPPPVVSLQGGLSSSVATGSVLSITGNSNVTLKSLEITEGYSSPGNGGGVNFSGNGSLTLIATTIDSNKADGNGGGIYLSGVGGTATLTLGAGSTIQGNSAAEGGGVYLAGSTRMVAPGPYVIVESNFASGSLRDQGGGGIMVAGPPPAQADLGAMVIYNNQAGGSGGGIAVVAHGPANAGFGVGVRLFGTQISTNSTINFVGGGVYVRPAWDSTAAVPVHAVLCAMDFKFTKDYSQHTEGNEIFADSVVSSGVTIGDAGVVQLNPNPPCEDANYGVSLASLGWVPCSSPGCSSISLGGLFDPFFSRASTIYINSQGKLDANRFIMINDSSTHEIYLAGSSKPANITNCLLVNNVDSGELIYADDVPLNIDSCTLANNTISGTSVIYSVGGSNNVLQDSIIDQPGIVTLNAGASMGIHYVLSNDISTIPGATQGAPTYVDSVSFDYHLQVNSLGVDFAPAASFGTGTPSLDLDGMARVIDIPSVANVNGPRDLGPYEHHPPCYRLDTPFCDGFDANF